MYSSRAQFRFQWVSYGTSLRRPPDTRIETNQAWHARRSREKRSDVAYAFGLAILFHILSQL